MNKWNPGSPGMSPGPYRTHPGWFPALFLWTHPVHSRGHDPNKLTIFPRKSRFPVSVWKVIRRKRSTWTQHLEKVWGPRRDAAWEWAGCWWRQQPLNSAHPESSWPCEWPSRKTLESSIDSVGGIQQAFISREFLEGFLEEVAPELRLEDGSAESQEKEPREEYGQSHGGRVS